MDKILLFIPCYNCENEIINVLNSLKDNYYKFFSKILIVDNCSSDNTVNNVLKFASENSKIPLSVIKNNNNYSLGGSHKVAFDYAIEKRYDYVVVFHGDNQGDISDIKNILEEKLYKNYDCCLGARFMKGSKLVNYSIFRILGNICFNILFSLCLLTPLYDLGAGLNIYSVKMLNNKFYYKFPDALTFNYLMIMAADFYKHKYMFFPITWKESGSVSNVKVANQAFDLLNKFFGYLLFREKFIKSELRNKIYEKYQYSIILKAD